MTKRLRLKKHALFITVGLVGTGKTTIAKALADKLKLEYISSDITRKRLAGIPETEHFYGGFNEGIYSPEFSDRVYDKIYKQARINLREGNSIIVDASFIKRREREYYKGLAEVFKADFKVIECRLNEVLVKERLANRRETPSDGRWDTYLEQKKVFEPVVDIPAEQHIVVDTLKPTDENVERIVGRIENEE